MIKRGLFLLGTILVIICLQMISLPQAQAQTGDGHNLTWNTFDGGGLIGSTGGIYGLSGTIGQHDASATLDGGVYTLAGGFWPGIPPNLVYIPIIKR